MRRKSFCLTCVGWMMCNVEALIAEARKASKAVYLAACFRLPVEPVSGESARQQLAAWQTIVNHPIFGDCLDSRDTLIGAMMSVLDGVSVPVPAYEYGVKAPVSDKSYDIVPARSEQQARGMLEGTRRSKLMRRVPAGDWELVPVGVFDGE